MKEITKILYKQYALNKLKYDFAGYKFDRPQQLTYHHILARRYGGPLTLDNGAVLRAEDHNYFHTIELYDPDMFGVINSLLKIENEEGHIDMDCIRAIDDILTCFEREYWNKRTRKGNLIVKPEYIDLRILNKRNRQ